METATTATSILACCAASRPSPAAKEIRTKANSPPCASEKEKSEARGAFMRASRAMRIKHEELDDDESKHRADDQGRCRGDEPEIDAGADGDEEHGKQQALEGIEIHLEFMAVFAFGEQHAGEEGAEGRREADGLHEKGDADDERRAQGHEDFAQARSWR